MANERYRLAEQKVHQVLGAYLVFWAWRRGVDCVSLSREVILDYLQLDRSRKVRFNWLRNDLQSFFPYSLTTQNKQKVRSGVYLSRKPFPQDLWSPSTRLRLHPGGGGLDVMERAGLVIGFPKQLPSESDVLTQLAKLANGLGDPVVK